MIFTAFSSDGMLPQNTTFNSDFMCNTILPNLNKNARAHPKIKMNQKIYVHMDNAKPHRSKKVREKM